MAKAIPDDIPDVYLGGSGIDQLEVPEYEAEWLDYANAVFQVGPATLAEGANRVVEYTGNVVGNEGMADFGQRGAQYWDRVAEAQREDYSIGALQKKSKKFATWDEDAAWRDLGAVMLHGGESAAATALSMTPIGAAVRAGVTSKAALSAIGAVTEGLIGAGYIAGDIAKEIEGFTPEQLAEIPGVADLRVMGWSDDEIKKALKVQQQAATVPGGALFTAATGAALGPMQGSIFRGGTFGIGKPGSALHKFSESSALLPRTAKGVITEGIQEAVQETGETVASNIGTGREPMEGTLEAALAGAFTGGPMGGTFAAATGGKTRKQKQAEAGYKQILLEGTPEDIELTNQLLIMGMGEEQAASFIKAMEEEVKAEKEQAKARVASEEEQAALKAHEEKSTAAAEPTQAATEPKQAIPTEPDQKSVEEAQAGAALDAEAEAEAAAAQGEFVGPQRQPKYVPFTGGGITHFTEALNASLDDASSDPSVGKPMLTKKGKPSKAKVRPKSVRAVAVAGIADDVQESLRTLKAEGYDVSPIENVLDRMGMMKEGRTRGEVILKRLQGNSGDGIYLPLAGGKKKLGGNKAIDAFLKDLVQASYEVEQAGKQKVFVEDKPTPEPKKSIQAQLDAVKDGRKKGVLVTPGTRVGKLPAGFKRTKLANKKGWFIYKENDKESAATARAWARDEAAHPEFAANILNYGTGRKGTGDKVTTVRDKDGTVIQDVVGEGGAVERAAKEVAGKDGTVETRPAEEAVAEREAEVAKETKGETKKASTTKPASKSRAKPDAPAKPKAVQSKPKGKPKAATENKPAENIKEALNRVVREGSSKYRRKLAKLIIRNSNDKMLLIKDDTAKEGNEDKVLAESLQRMVESMTEGELNSRQKEALKELEKLRVFAETALGWHPGPKDQNKINEFIVRGMVDEKFQHLLKGIKLEKERTVWSRFTDLLRKLLGVKESNTAMGELLYQVTELMDATTLKGVPDRIYHGSTEAIGKFRATDLGVHFGNKDQALDRNAAYLHDIVNESLKSVIRLTEPEGGSWHNPAAVLDMFDKNGIHVSDGLRARIEAWRSKGAVLPPTDMDKTQRDLLGRLRGVLYNEGYDTVVYKNEHEGTEKGKDSYIFLNPELIKGHNVIKSKTYDDHKASKAVSTPKVKKHQGDLEAAAAVDDLWKIAQGSHVPSVQETRKVTGVTDERIEYNRIRQLLQIAVDEIVAGEGSTTELPAYERAAVKKLQEFAIAVRDRGSISTQVKELPRPPELISEKTGKSIPGQAATARKIKLVGKDAKSLARGIRDTFEEQAYDEEFEEMVEDAIASGAKEEQLIDYLEEVNASPAVIQTIIEAVQAGRMLIADSGAAATDEVVTEETHAFDKAETINAVVQEANNPTLTTAGVEMLIQEIGKSSEVTRADVISGLLRMLRTQYGVSEATTNALSQIINDEVGLAGAVKEDSLYEEQESYAKAGKGKVRDSGTSIGRASDTDLTAERVSEGSSGVYDNIFPRLKVIASRIKEIITNSFESDKLNFQRDEMWSMRQSTGELIGRMALASTTTNPLPAQFVIDLAVNTLHKSDPLRSVLNRVKKLGYIDTNFASIEKRKAKRIGNKKGVRGLENAPAFVETVLDENTDELNRTMFISTRTAAKALERKIGRNGRMDWSAFLAYTFAHEALHVATTANLLIDDAVQQKVVAMMDDVRRQHPEESADLKANYGMTNEYEFISEAFTSHEFMELLNNTTSSRTPGQSIWQEFVELVKKMLGIEVKAGSILEEVISLSDDIIISNEQTNQKLTEALSQFDEDVTTELQGAFNEGRKFRPKNRKLINAINQGNGGFVGGAAAAAIPLFDNAGGGAFESLINHAKQGSAAVRRFMLGNMMLDQIATNYNDLFDGLMDNVDRLVMGDSYIDKNNPLGVLIRAMQNRQAAAKKFEAEANDLLERVKSMEEGDYKARGLDAEQRRQAVQDMYDVAHDATMAQIHPDEEWDSKHNKDFYDAKKRGKNEAKLAHEKARVAYLALPTEVQNLYKEMRDFYTSSQAVGRGKLRTNLIRRFNMESLENLDVAAAVMQDLSDTEVDALDLSGFSKADAADIRYALKSINNQTLPNGPYFPLLRYGDYVAEVRKVTETEFDLSKYKNKTARKNAMTGMANRLKAENPGSKVNYRDVEGTDIKVLVHTEYQFISDETKDGIEKRRRKLEADGYEVGQARKKGETDFADVSAASKLMAVAERKLKGNEEDKTMARTALREALVTFMPEYSMKKRLMERKYISGASHDMGRALANYTKSAAWSLANLDYIHDITEASHSLNRADMNADRSNKTYTDEQLEDMRHVAEELKRRLNNTNEPGKITEWSSKLGFFNYLFSISYSVVNSTQPALITVPYLSGIYGTRKTMGAMKQAYSMVAGQIAKEALSRGFGAAAFTKTGVDANLMVTELREAIQAKENNDGLDMMLKTLQDEDIIGATFALEITEMAKGRGRKGKVSSGFHKLLEAGRTMPHIVEIMNRTTTAVATYKLAMEGKQDTEANRRAATEAARLAVRKTQFDYSELNRPFNFVRNDLLRAMTMFKIHPLGVYGLMIGNVKMLLNNKLTSDEGKAAFKTLAMLLSTHAMFAGVAGSILMEPIRVAMGMLSMMLSGLSDDDTAEELKAFLQEPEVAIRQFLFEATGSRTASEVMTFGLPRIAGVDMHTRLGLQSLMMMASNEGDTQFERAMNTVHDSLMGPIFGMEGGFTRMAAALANGQGWGKASEYAMPKGIRDIQRAFRYGSEGMTDFNGNLIQNSDSFSNWDLATRVIGFSPSVEAETHFGRGYINRRTGRLKRKSNGLINRWKGADKAERRELWDSEIRAFNDSLSADEKRAFRITQSKLRRSLRSREKRERETYKGAHFTRKERKMKKELDFINL